LSVQPSSDLSTLPSPPVVMETHTDVTPVTEVNKQRLPRQLAVTDDHELSLTMAKIADKSVEDVTTSLELSIGMIVCI